MKRNARATGFARFFRSVSPFSRDHHRCPTGPRERRRQRARRRLPRPYASRAHARSPARRPDVRRSLIYIVPVLFAVRCSRLWPVNVRHYGPQLISVYTSIYTSVPRRRSRTVPFLYHSVAPVVRHPPPAFAYQTPGKYPPIILRVITAVVFTDGPVRLAAHIFENSSPPVVPGNIRSGHPSGTRHSPRRRFFCFSLTDSVSGEPFYNVHERVRRPRTPSRITRARSSFSCFGALTITAQFYHVPSSL